MLRRAKESKYSTEPAYISIRFDPFEGNIVPNEDDNLQWTVINSTEPEKTPQAGVQGASKTIDILF